MRFTILFTVCCLLTGCHTMDRLFRTSPLGAAPEADRVNLWPLYYQNGDAINVLWPVFDYDARGFSLRPIVTKDGDDWELLPPVAWWNTESGDWVFLPAHVVGDSHGVFPVYGSFEGWNYVGPAWWSRNEEDLVDKFGLFPLARFADVGLDHVGPVWWSTNEDDEVESYGLFPLVGIGKGLNHFGPAFWGYNGDGDASFVAGIPLFVYARRDDGGGALVTLLGGRGWDEEGETDLLNVLGPIYHYHEQSDGVARAVLWPIYSSFDGPGEKSWSVWPLAEHTTRFDAEGEPIYRETSALAGIINARDLGEGYDAWRVLPLFTVRGSGGAGWELADSLTLFGYSDGEDDRFYTHIGTPMLFNYRRGGELVEWSGLLNTLQYRDVPSIGKDGELVDFTEFDLLWYLYRYRKLGTETSRDFFPFFSWDSSAERSRFSFLWRVFNWERDGDKTGGHFLFIPWGDT